MPTKTSERWIDDGNNVKAKLEALGYKVDLQYANDSVPQQQQQIESMLNNGAKALIVASIDGTALTQQLADAGKDGVKVIAYDRLINGTPNVDYYVTFDNEKVGVQQGTSLLTGLGILDADGKDTGKTGPVQRRALRRQPGRQQRAVLLQRRDERPAALHRQGHAQGRLGPDRLQPGRHPAVEARDRAGPHGDHPQRLLRQGRHQARRRAVARTTACRAAS